MAQTPVPRPFPGAGGAAPSSSRPAEPERQAPPPAGTETSAPGARAGGAAQPGRSQPTAPGAARSEAAAPVPATRPNPDAAALGSVPIYPTADFLESFDAGRGQRYHIYGTNQPYEEIVAYYRTVLDNGGREIYREPAVRQFDLGRFDDGRMAFPPSIVVKDYGWNGSPGYLFVDGTTATRYRTIIQVVPPPAPAPR
jgi:hypothetical protein